MGFENIKKRFEIIGNNKWFLLAVNICHLIWHSYTGLWTILMFWGASLPYYDIESYLGHILFVLFTFIQYLLLKKRAFKIGKTISAFVAIIDVLFGALSLFLIIIDLFEPVIEPSDPIAWVIALTILLRGIFSFTLFWCYKQSEPKICIEKNVKSKVFPIAWAVLIVLLVVASVYFFALVGVENVLNNKPLPFP